MTSNITGIAAYTQADGARIRQNQIFNTLTNQITAARREYGPQDGDHLLPLDLIVHRNKMFATRVYKAFGRATNALYSAGLVDLRHVPLDHSAPITFHHTINPAISFSHCLHCGGHVAQSSGCRFGGDL